MSWSSRFGSWSGRFSPFYRNGTSYGDSRVTEKDYSYITPSELAQEDSQASSAAAAASADSHGDLRRHSAHRETDVVVFKHKRESYPVHFPAYSIDKNELTIGEMRVQAARKLGVSNPRRIKLLYRGRNMRDDASTASEMGLRSDSAAEVMCVVGELPPSSGGSSGAYDGVDGRAGDDEDVDMEDDADGDTHDETGDDTGDQLGAPKRKRNRRGKRKSRKDRSGGPDASSGLNVGGGDSSMASSVSGMNGSATLPATPLERLETLASGFRTNLVPQCLAFTAAPPTDFGKRQFEHKRLTETILAQVLLKLDAVETEGDDEARRRRKEVVRECQDMLAKLDEVVK